LLNLIVPLLAFAIRRAGRTAIAMESAVKNSQRSDRVRVLDLSKSSYLPG
jgi:energy-coupling factor transporter transmembrane protein EcfT